MAPFPQFHIFHMFCRESGSDLDFTRVQQKRSQWSWRAWTLFTIFPSLRFQSLSLLHVKIACRAFRRMYPHLSLFRREVDETSQVPSCILAYFINLNGNSLPITVSVVQYSTNSFQWLPPCYDEINHFDTKFSTSPGHGITFVAITTFNTFPKLPMLLTLWTNLSFVGIAIEGLQNLFEILSVKR